MTDDEDDADADDGEPSRRQVLGAVAAVGVAGVAAGSRSGGATRGQDDAVPAGESVGLETVAEGFAAPLGLEVAPEDRDRQFVVDQPGVVYVLEENEAGAALREAPFLDVGDRVVDLGDASPGRADERGLLGLAFHPGFVENRRLFVLYSAPPRDGTPEEFDHITVVAEFRATDDGERTDPDSERTILAVPSPGPNHNGGRIAFGPDGDLFVPLGDGGGEHGAGPGHADDWYDRNDGGNGQDVTENLLGSVLRIDVDGRATVRGEEKEYAIPDDNPLVGEEGLDEHYAWGFRDPRHLSFDSRGRLFVTDVGWNGREEVNLVERGGNYGWNVRVGAGCFDAEAPLEPPGDCPGHTPEGVRGGEPLRDPVVAYPPHESTRVVNDSSVLVGGHVYGGDAVEHLRGEYVFADWSAGGLVDPAGRLLAATPPEVRETPTPTDTPTGTPGKTTYELAATVDGWQGQSPDEIKSDLNPTLTLVRGQPCEVTWQNLDGEAHNFALVDDDDEVLASSQVISGEGMTQTFEFDPTPEMAAYVCEIHPTSMRGSVELAGGGAGGDGGSEDAPQDGPGSWPLEQLVVDGTEAGLLDEFVYGIGRDGTNDLYVLTAEDAVPSGDSGAVRRIVPPGADGGDVD